ncbi:aspartic peptidase domain-containing protein [Mycena olivaceomarginata]|nr:aspartic peptidase domain-containing protein [Mycena olivaceomarginata]
MTLNFGPRTLACHRVPAWRQHRYPVSHLRHSNVAVQQHEKRFSITQYISGGIFRFAKGGFKTDVQLKKHMSTAWERLRAPYIDEDTVTMGSLVIKDRLIGVADNTTDMDNMDGILVDLIFSSSAFQSLAAITSDNTPIPTVTDNCLNQRLIANESIGIYYESTAADNDSNGKTGAFRLAAPISPSASEINYVPITKTADGPCVQVLYWGIDQSICYNGKEIMANCVGIADTGMTMCMLPESTFQTYKEEVGAKLDPFILRSTQFEGMQDMCFEIGGKEYKLTPYAQTWLRSQNENLGIPKDAICLIFASLGQMENKGLDFINEYPFLRFVL